MKLTALLFCTLFGLGTSCGYAPAEKILFGGISSAGNKSEDDAVATAEKVPQSGDASSSVPKSGDMMPVPLPAPLATCASAQPFVADRSVAGRVYDMRAKPESACEGADASCLASLTFAKDGTVAARYDGLALVTLHAYQQCGDEIRIAFASTAGGIVIEALKMSPDQQMLVHFGTSRAFSLRTAP